AADARPRRGAGRARRRRERVMDVIRARRRAIAWRARAANLFGAVMAFVYFRFIDPVTSGPEFTWREIVFFVVAFTALSIVAARIGMRWAAPMVAGDRTSPDAQRRALLFPWIVAGVSLLNWVVAGAIFGVVGPLLAGWPLTVQSAVRAIVGITAVGGLVTAVIVFFSVESRWRRELPAFFPTGGVGAVRGVPPVPVLACPRCRSLEGSRAWVRSFCSASPPGDGARGRPPIQSTPAGCSARWWRSSRSSSPRGCWRRCGCRGSCPTASPRRCWALRSRW